MLETDRQQMTLQFGAEKMRVACGVAKARTQTHTHTYTHTLIICIILIAFQ